MALLSDKRGYYSTEHFFAAIVISIVVAGLAGFFIGRSSVSFISGSTVSGGDLMDTNSVAGIADITSQRSKSGEYSILVYDQRSGDKVSVALIHLRYASWVAIHEDRNGGPGNVLGAQWFDSGETKDGTVELLRPTVKGRYYAVIHNDLGADHRFEVLEDSAFKDEDGKMIVAPFNVSDPL